jgi:hypothetical protein
VVGAASSTQSISTCRSDEKWRCCCIGLLTMPLPDWTSSIQSRSCVPQHRYSYFSYWCYRSLIRSNICCHLGGFQAGPSTARFLSIVHRSSMVACDRKLTAVTSTCVTSLSELEIGVIMRCDSSHAGSRHGIICEIRERKSHALRHRFGDSRFALPAPGHLEAPAPRTRTEICRYPVVSSVGCSSRSCEFPYR